MGIRGIYKEIGPGRRVSLCKLAVEHLEQTGRPLRLAVDISIWQFQVQAAKGGANPAIRTLFYRLVRLLGLGIDALFVFDGPHKPAFKRHRRSRTQGGDRVADAAARRLIGLFGFAAHDAPGEAEAECALLQRAGVVDAVLSEDVDTIMFGCGRTLRAWTADANPGGGGGGGATGPPTHVSVYDADGGTSGLGREGMVLVALMSGGDYLPEGVPKCGPKVACEAARAGFGAELCAIKTGGGGDGLAALAAWRERLARELRENESGFFRTRHAALRIPDGFPDLEILRYYTHPVVSKPATVDRLRRDREQRGKAMAAAVDISGLRAFSRDTLDWAGKPGAIKFARVLAPALLMQMLLGATCHDDHDDHDDHVDPKLRQARESKLVRAISSRRAHPSTDATPELRLSYVPADVVALDFASEPDHVDASEDFGRTGLALNSDDEFDMADTASVTGSQTMKKKRKVFDPTQPDLAWIPESVAKLGVPLTVQDWEAEQREKRLHDAARAAAREERAETRKMKNKNKKKATDISMPSGALDGWVKVTKTAATTSPVQQPHPVTKTTSPAPTKKSTVPTAAPSSRKPVLKKPSTSKARTSETAVTQARPANPWASSSQSNPHVARITKPSGSVASVPPSSLDSGRGTKQQLKDHSVVVISSSPPATPPRPVSIAPVPTSTPGSPCDHLKSRAALPKPGTRSAQSAIAVSTTSASPADGSQSRKPWLVGDAAKESTIAPLSPLYSRNDHTLLMSLTELVPAPASSNFAAEEVRQQRKKPPPPSLPRRTTENVSPEKKKKQKSIKDYYWSSPGKKATAERGGITIRNATSPPAAVEVVDLSSDCDDSRDDDPFTMRQVSSPSKQEQRYCLPHLPSVEKERPAPNPKGDSSVSDSASESSTPLPQILTGTTPPLPLPPDGPTNGNSTTTTTTTTTKLYVHRGGASAGYFVEVEVDCDEAKRMTDKATSGSGRRKTMAWRHSDIHVVDLTGE